MKTTNRVPSLSIARLEAAGLFDGRDCEGSIGDGDDRLLFIFRAQGAGLLWIGGHPYHIALVPSNLGRGHLRYFTCPFTHRRTRTLYRPHPRLSYGHRTAFRPAIGYATQLTGRQYHLRRSFELEEQADQLREQITRWEHRGEPTRRVRRLEAIDERAARYWLHAIHTNRVLRAVMAFKAATSPKD